MAIITSISREMVARQMCDYIGHCQEAVSKYHEVPGAFKIISDEFIGTSQPPAANIEEIEEIRQRLIRIKIDHTTAVVLQIQRIAEREGMPDALKEVLDVVARLHDIGRFFQGVLNNTYSESKDSEMYRSFAGSQVFKDLKGFEEFSRPLTKNGKTVTYHNVAGEVLLRQGVIPELSKNEREAEAIINAVLYHQFNDSELPKYMQDRRDRGISVREAKSAFDKLLSQSSRFSEAQRIMCTFLTQLVKDVDGLDILHQHLTGDFPVIRKKISFNRVGPCLEVKDGKEELVDKTLSLEELIERWCIIEGNREKRIAEIKDYLIRLNDPKGLEENVLKKVSVSIPVENTETGEQLLDLSKFKMPIDLERDYNNAKPMNLKVISKRIEFNPAVGMCWRLQNLLGGIRFSSNLINVLESTLIDEIFKKYPEEVQANLKDAFAIAKELYLSKDRIVGLYTLPSSELVERQKGTKKR